MLEIDNLSEGDESDEKIPEPRSMRERLFDINMFVIFAGLSIGAVFISVNFVGSVIKTIQKMHDG